jgi:hypothetical protein
MAVRPHWLGNFTFPAAVLFLPTVGVVAGWYAAHEPLPESRQSNELTPAELGQGFAPGPLSTPVVAENRTAGVPNPESIERPALLNALEVRRLTASPEMPVEQRNRR